MAEEKDNRSDAEKRIAQNIPEGGATGWEPMAVVEDVRTEQEALDYLKSEGVDIEELGTKSDIINAATAINIVFPNYESD